MRTKKKSVFRGKTRTNAEQRKRGNAYGYLQVPKGIDVFTLEKNECKIIMDIMPYVVTDKNHPDLDKEEDIATEGSLWYKRPLKVHRNVGANHTSQICLASIGKKCPICEFREAQRKDEGDEKLISSLRPSRKNLYCVRILSIDGKPVREKNFQLFDFSDALFQEKLEEQIGDKPEFDYFPDPYEGVSIYVRFDEDSFGGFKFARPTRFEFEKREEQYTEEDLEQIPKLDDCLKIMDYEELKEMFFSGDIDSGDDDEEDEKPRKSKTVEKDEEPEERTTRRKKRQSRDEDEGITIEELDKMDIDELTDYCEKNKLKIDPYEYKEDEEDELRQDMAEELGLTKEEEPEPEPEPEPARRKSKRGKDELECPFGHKFGKDNDRFDDCDDCELWNECNEMKKQSRK